MTLTMLIVFWIGGSLLIFAGVVGAAGALCVRERVWDHDRRRHVAEMRCRERLASGEAVAEAMVLQLREIRALPSVEPARRAA